MASEDVKTRESAVSTFVNLAEEAKLAREGVKAPSYAILTICKSLFAGGVAGGVSRTAVAPLERLKILLQVQNPHNIKYSGTVQGLKYIWRTEGFRGLFKGNGTNCARIVPNSAVKFFSYEQASKGILTLYQQQTGNGLSPLTRRIYLGLYCKLQFHHLESVDHWQRKFFIKNIASFSSTNYDADYSTEMKGNSPTRDAHKCGWSYR